MRVTIPGKGVLQGTTSNCHRFGSVPYALPPTSERRWRKPQPLPRDFSYGTTQHPGDFTRPSPPCPQISAFRELPFSSEDCLRCNIWVPVGKPPTSGWPVLFWLHGGFLQVGSVNMIEPSDLIQSTEVKCIVVAPGHRLGVLGFLASENILGSSVVEANTGFWDQRLALEWTHENIKHFGGNENNITIGGYSAGAYSAFHQLAHDIHPNRHRQIIRRVLQFSNSCGVEPKPVSEGHAQFERLLAALGIPRSLDSSERLEILRYKPADELIRAVEKMDEKFFRPVLDGAFIDKNLFPSIYNGNFGRRMKDLGIQIMLGDLTQEYRSYQATFPPKSYEGMIQRLCWDYPQKIVQAVCSQYAPSNLVEPRSSQELISIFGHLYADMQIHATMRGQIQSMAQALPLSSIYRYRIDWRTKSVDNKFPREAGATHTSDLSIWFFGNGEALTPGEKDLISEWLRPLASFINGEKVNWGPQDMDTVRCITADGRIEHKKDELWYSKLPLWEEIRKATLLQQTSRESKL